MSVQDLKGQLSQVLNDIGGSEVAAIEPRWRAAAQLLNSAADGTQNADLSTAAAQLLRAADDLARALLVTQLIAAQVQSYMSAL